MNDPAPTVEPPLRRVVRLLDHPSLDHPSLDRPPLDRPLRERPPAPEPPVRLPEPAPARDRSRPAHCRIAMQFED